MMRALVTALAVSAFASAAGASVFFGVTADKLVRIDTATQAVSTIGTLQVGPTTLSVMADCEFDASGTLYGLQQGSGSGGFPPPPLNKSFRINTTTATALLVADYGNTQHANALAYSQSLGKFLTVSSDNGRLATLDPTTGAITQLFANNHGLGGPNKIEALAFAPTGDLYGIWDGGPPLTGMIDHKLVRFNLATGTATAIGSIGTGAQRFFSLRFDEGGTAYTIDAFSGTVETINLATGQGTAVFSNAALNGTTGLALQIPAPGTAAGTLCLAGLLSARRRRR
jgi:hypothetical protein